MKWIDLFSLFSLLVYIVASASALVALLGRTPRFNRVAFWLTIMGFCLHTILICALFAALGPLPASRSLYLMILAWCLVGAGLILWWRMKMDMMLLFATPLAFLLLFISLVMDGHSAELPAALTGPVFFLHLAGVFFGIGLIAIAAGAGFFFLWQERTIKSKTPLHGFKKDLPALMALDRINALATLVGFPAYSLGVIAGFIWAKVAWGTSFSGDPKEWISLGVWALYATLFHKRQAHGWRGKKPAILVICLFLVSFFSLFVVNTVLPTHHSFDAGF